MDGPGTSIRTIVLLRFVGEHGPTAGEKPRGIEIHSEEFSGPGRSD